MKKIILNENQKKIIIKEYIDSKHLEPLYKYLTKNDEDKELELFTCFVSSFKNFLEDIDYTKLDMDFRDDDEYEEFACNVEEELDTLDMLDDDEYDEKTIEFAKEIMYGKYKGCRKLFYKYIYYLIDMYPGYNNSIPSWVYLTNPEIVKNEWLIHFSNDAYDISKNGFTKSRGFSKERISCTRQDDSYFTENGYCFAYDLNDFGESFDRWSPADKKTNIPKYGKEAVIFMASGIKCFHKGDMENQVIFWGPAARNIIYVKKNNNEWCIISNKKNNILYRNESLESVVNWAVNNMTQYSRQIINDEPNKRNRGYEKGYYYDDIS